MLRILIPRLTYLAIFIAVLAVARNSLCRYALEHYVRSRLGLPVTIGSLQIRPVLGTLELRDVRVPDPLRPEEVFANIDSIFVKLDMNDVLRRQYTVEHARVRGIHYQTTFEESRFFLAGERWKRLKDRFPEFFPALARQEGNNLFSGTFDRHVLRDLEGQFESARYVREISPRWKDETLPLLEQAQTLSDRVNRLRGLFRDPERLRAADRIALVAALLRDAESLEHDLKTLSDLVVALERSARQDAVTLKEKLRDDYERLKTMQAPKLDPQTITEVFVGEEILKRYAGLSAWVDSIHTLLETPNDYRSFLNVRRTKGTDVQFASRKNVADYRLKTLDFDGDVFFEGEPIRFLGRVTDAVLPVETGNSKMLVRMRLDSERFTSGEPGAGGTDESGTFAENEKRFEDVFMEIAEKDAETIFELAQNTLQNALNSSPECAATENGESEFPAFSRTYVTAAFDFRATPPRETYRVTFPEIRFSERTLGTEDGLVLRVSPGKTKTFAEIRREGEIQRGQVRLRQFPIRLTPELPRTLRGTPLEQSLCLAAAAVDRLDVRAHWNGTFGDSDFSLESDLGHRLAGAIQPVLLRLWNDARREAARELNARTNVFLADMNESFGRRLNPTLRELEKIQTEIVGNNSRLSAEQAVQTLVSSLSKRNGSDTETSSRPGKEQSERVPEETLRDVLNGWDRENLEQELKDGFFRALNPRYGRDTVVPH